jgi:hypothetical protein
MLILSFEGITFDYYQQEEELHGHPEKPAIADNFCCVRECCGQ